MKSLRPFTSLALGSLLTGLVIAVVMGVGQPDMLTPRGVGIAFGLGSLGGLIMVAPIAAGEAFRPRLVRLLGRHAFGVHWSTSLLMAAGMGYLAAAFHLHAFGRGAFVAMVLVFSGAWIKILLGVVYDERSKHA